jgi:hypothetical protein
VLCFGWLVCLLSGFIWFSIGLARLPFFWGGGGEGEGGRGKGGSLFCFVLLVPFWSREDDEYGGSQGGSGLVTIVFSSG